MILFTYLLPLGRGVFACAWFLTEDKLSSSLDELWTMSSSSCTRCCINLWNTIMYVFFIFFTGLFATSALLLANMSRAVIYDRKCFIFYFKFLYNICTLNRFFIHIILLRKHNFNEIRSIKHKKVIVTESINRSVI